LWAIPPLGSNISLRKGIFEPSGWKLDSLGSKPAFVQIRTKTNEMKLKPSDIFFRTTWLEVRTKWLEHSLTQGNEGAVNGKA